MTVSTAVVALTQLKWAGLHGRWAPVVVLAVSALGVVAWAVADGPLGRHHLFELFAGWIAVATSAAGVFGFTRATAERLVGQSGTGSRGGSE